MKDDGDRFYELLQSVGRNAASLMLPLLRRVVEKFDPGEEGAIVVTRLRRAAKLFDLPVKKSGQRGRPRQYGKNRMGLKMRAGHPGGWETIRDCCRGVMVERRCKTFLATSHLAGGAVRVVLLEHSPDNWAPYVSTDISMSAKTIPKTASDRWAIEEPFHEVKEVWGAGEQRTRNMWLNESCWNLCGWLYFLVELERGHCTSEQLVNRSDRPWDNPSEIRCSLRF